MKIFTVFERFPLTFVFQYGKMVITEGYVSRFSHWLSPHCRGEKWKMVVYRGRQHFDYFVSTCGRVISIRHRSYPALTTQCLNKAGYYITTIWPEKQVRVHRLVAETFIDGKTEKKHEVNHKNRNTWDNHIKNLEWVTPAMNALHAVIHRRIEKEYGTRIW
jgi:hypothetical protein